MRIKTKTVMDQMNAEKPDDVLAGLEAKHGSQQRMVGPLALLAAIAEQTDVRIIVQHTGKIQLYDFGADVDAFEAENLTPMEAAKLLAAALADRPLGWKWPNADLSCG